MANPFAASAAAALPNPVFEGSEKRLEIDFTFSAGSPAAGLRALSRAQLDELMTLAACTIVSSRSNADLDAYVLSESSLFVYPAKWVLKTCGTTRLLAAVPRLLEMAAVLGMAARRCKYSRASFLFPEQQPFPHTSFDQEAFYLRSHFGHLGNGGSAYVMGDMFNGLQWHVYVADASGAAYEPAPGILRPTYKMEMCMTELAPEAAAQFFRTSNFVSAKMVTKASGIAALVPGMTIDDYVFEPCGYSMNGIRGGGFMTIHITPEAGFSYASVEVSGFGAGECDPADLAARVAAIFRPGRMSVSLSVDVASRSGGYSWGTLAYAPLGLGCQSATCQELAAGGRVSFYNFAAVQDGPAAATNVGVANGMGEASMLPPNAAAAAAAVGKGLTRCESPVTVLLRHMPSFSSLRSESSDADASSSGDEQDCAGEWSRRIQGAQGVAERAAKTAGAAAPGHGSFCPSF